MAHDIEIHPKLVGSDLDKMNEKLSAAEEHLQRMMTYASKITIPGVSGGSGSAGGGGGSGTPGASGGGGTNASERATQYAQERMPPRARETHGRSGAPNASMNSGQFLTNFQDVIQPILPQLDQMMQQPGGKANATSALRQHLSQVQRIAAQPAGSSAESQAILAANQASGIDPAALASAAAQYRTTNPTHGAVINAYLKAQQQAAATGSAGGAGGTAITGVIQRLAGAAGYGELGGLLGGGLAATGVGAAALGVGYVASNVRQGWSTYLQQGTAFSALSKTLGTLGESFNTLRTQVDATSRGFAESVPTITAATQAIAPYTGNIGTRGLTHLMTASQGLAFSMGLNPVSTAQAFGQAAQVGILGTGGSVGQMSGNQFAALIANATAAGSMQGRQGQVLAAMLSVSQQLAAQLGHAPNANLLASIMTSLNSSGSPVLQGTMGAQVLGSINQGIISPGGGSAFQQAAYQALNPNNKLSYAQERLLQAQGINGVNPTTGVSNFAAELHYYMRNLPGGKVQYQRDKYGRIATTQSANAAMIMGVGMHLTQPQALAVMEAFSGKSLSQVNHTQQLAAALGPTALSTLIKKGGIGILGDIANAQHVSGRHGLNALAHEVTGNLHGHVAHHFYQLEKQYAHLGPGHAHQRALDFTQMQKTLGQSVLHGPTLQTSLDKLTSTMTKANLEWARIGRDLHPIAQVLAGLNLTYSRGLGQMLTSHSPTSLGLSLLGPVLGPLLDRVLGAGKATGSTPLPGIQHYPAYRGSLPAGTTAYTIPGVAGSSPQTQIGATLASFVLGNQQSSLGALLAAAMGARTGGGPAPTRTADWVTPFPVPSPGASPAQKYVQQFLPVARSHNVTRWNSLAQQDMAKLAHRNPHLNLAAIDTILGTQSGGLPGLTFYNKKTGTTDFGLMQLDSGNFGQWHLNARQALNPQTNLAVGIQFFNHLLNQYHGNVGKALEGYAGISPQGATDASDMLAVLQALLHHTQRIEKNTRPLKNVHGSTLGA